MYPSCVCPHVCSFYEWQTTKPGLKQPYFIHFADNKPTAETQEVLAEQGVEFKGIDNPPPNEGRMLTMAGLFDIWRPPHEVRLKTQQLLN